MPTRDMYGNACKVMLAALAGVDKIAGWAAAKADFALGLTLWAGRLYAVGQVSAAQGKWQAALLCFRCIREEAVQATQL